MGNKIQPFNNVKIYLNGSEIGEGYDYPHNLEWGPKLITADGTGEKSVTKSNVKSEYCINPLGIDVADIPVITDIDVIVPGLITMVYFSDGGKEKMRLQDGDTWDLITCCYYALAKHLYRKTLNYKGIEYMANMLSMYKGVEKMVDKSVRRYNRDQKKAQERKERQAKSKGQIKVRKAKSANRDNSEPASVPPGQGLAERIRDGYDELCQVLGIKYESLNDLMTKIANLQPNEETGETPNCCPKHKEDTD